MDLHRHAGELITGMKKNGHWTDSASASTLPPAQPAAQCIARVTRVALHLRAADPCVPSACYTLQTGSCCNTTTGTTTTACLLLARTKHAFELARRMEDHPAADLSHIMQRPHSVCCRTYCIISTGNAHLGADGAGVESGPASPAAPDHANRCGALLLGVSDQALYLGLDHRPWDLRDPRPEFLAPRAHVKVRRQAVTISSALDGWHPQLWHVRAVAESAELVSLRTPARISMVSPTHSARHGCSRCGRTDHQPRAARVPTPDVRKQDDGRG